MKMHIMRLFTFKLFAALALSAPAQNTNSTGMEHWVAFMENLDLMFNNTPSFHLVISSEDGANGQVEVPATGFATPFSVSAGGATVLTLPQNIYYAAGDEAPSDFGIRVSADADVSVYAYHDRTYFSEASIVLPTTSLGTDYLVVAREDDLNDSPSEFVVLATEDGTTIEITPSVVTASLRPPDVAFTIVLEEGQTYQMQAYEDLSGTRVRSLDPEKPIAVFGGARQAWVNCDQGADDHLYNQIYPLEMWGRSFTVVPFRERGGDQVRVLATTNGTIVSIGSASFFLNAGQVAEANMLEAGPVQANHPIAVAQFNDSQACNGASGDPCFLFVPPRNFRDQRCIWSSRDGDGTPEHYVNIVVQAGSGVDPILLDGVDISDEFDPVANLSGQWFAQVSIASGEHDLISEKAFQAVAYGFGDYNSYSFALGFDADVTTGVEEGVVQPAANTPMITQGENWCPNWNVTVKEEIRVLDARGRIVSNAGIKPNACIELATLDPGMYFFERWTQGQRIDKGRLIIR